MIFQDKRWRYVQGEWRRGPERWFAWYPVTLSDHSGRTVWLQKVTREAVMDLWGTLWSYSL